MRVSVRAAALISLTAGVAAIAFFAFRLYRGVSAAVPPFLPISIASASCEPVAPPGCEARIVALNSGRFRIEPERPALAVAVSFDGRSDLERATYFVIRAAVPGRLTTGSDVIQVHAGQRHVIRVAGGASAWRRVTLSSSSATEPVVIEELGFLRGSPPPDPPSLRFYARYVAGATLALCAAFVLTAWLLPATVASAFSPVLFAVLCLSVCILEVETTFSADWSRDLRSVYAAEIVHSEPGGNLTGGLYEGARIVQSLGQTLPSGMVQWHRMPGYGWMCALAAFVTRSTDIIDLAMAVVALQALLYSAAVGLFVAAAPRVFSPWVAWLLGVLLVLIPKQVASTQVDSVIAPAAVLGLSALLVHLERVRFHREPFRTFLLVNGVFAIWFALRNDVLPAWIVIAAVLASPRWRYVMVTAALIVMIAGPWALYKRQYTHRLDPMPTNTGEVFFLGLCEAPGAFPYDCSDAGYFEWARQLGYRDPTSSAASAHAVVEVVKHWLTYPVHFAFMLAFKFRRCVDDGAWPGLVTSFNRPYEWLRGARVFILLLAALILAVVVDHERRRSFLLGWAVLLNMPLFFVVYASAGRFYPAAGISLMAAAIPVLFERGFYRQLARHRWRAALVAAGLVALVAGGERMEHWIMSHDSVHYWAPLLDPARSTIRFQTQR